MFSGTSPPTLCQLLVLKPQLGTGSGRGLAAYKCGAAAGAGQCCGAALREAEGAVSPGVLVRLGNVSARAGGLRLSRSGGGSDPAQQPAPGAPEGAAPDGGPPGPPPNLSSNRRLQQTQAQVEEVVDIMRVNVDKVLERDQILSQLDDRADALQAGASQFESSAAKLKRKYWWKNCKMMIMMGVICALVVVVIVSKYQKAQDQR
ncbi:vesicle-associated membrane protein 1 [Aegotheles albertisi]